MVSELVRMAKDLKENPAYLAILVLTVAVDYMLVFSLPESRLGWEWRFASLLAITTLAIVAIGLLEFHSYHDVEQTREGVHLFQIPADGGINTQAYDFLNARFRSAQKAIYFTGDGFHRSDEQSRELARQLTDSMREALKNKVHVVRVQTSLSTIDAHVDMLAELMRSYGSSGLLELAVIEKDQPMQLADVMAIDPDSREGCLAEVLLSAVQMHGSSPASVAGTLMAIEGHQALARDVRDRILRIQAGSRQLTSEEDVRRHLEERLYYFAYGANMDESMMVERCTSAKRVGIGRLDNYQVSFKVPGRDGNGCVAGIKPSSGSRVYGVIWSISSSDITTLDAIEGVEYARRDCSVMSLENNTQRECVAYVAISETDGPVDIEYRDVVIGAAMTEGLPEEYIAELRAAAKA